MFFNLKIKKGFQLKLLVLTGILITFVFFILCFKSTNFPNQSKNITNTNLISNENTLQINKTIILDAGHGLPDGGATSKDGTILESDLNLQIVLKLQKLLKEKNINVILTRNTEDGIYSKNSKTIREKKMSDLENRVKISKTTNADLFLSIHMNSLNDSRVNGFQVFYNDKNSESILIAKKIQDNLNSSIEEFINTKNIKKMPDIYLKNKITIPFVLIECGFLSNSNDLSLLLTDSYQEHLSQGITESIISYFGN